MFIDGHAATGRATLPVRGAPELTRHVCTVFGCQIVLVAVGEPLTPFARVEAGLRELESRFSRFLDENELAALNDANGAWVHVSNEMERLLTHALRVSVESRGLVNIATTRAVERAGYVTTWPQPWRTDHVESAPAPIPPLTELLELRAGQARLRAGHRVDFGALAKGLWADDTVDLLGPDAAAGLGGDVSARGSGPEGSGWPVGLPNGRTVTVRDGGVATSGTSKRRSGDAHHIIDPRTGRPADTRIAEISVVARSATAAEWIATAALLDTEAATALQSRSDVMAVFVTQNEEVAPDER